MLTIEKIKEIWKHRNNIPDSLKYAIEYEQKLQVHTQTLSDKNEAENHEGIRMFYSWISGGMLLPDDKLGQFKAAMKPPFNTNELAKDVFTDNSAIFTASDRKVSIVSETNSAIIDAYTRVTDSVKPFEFIKNKAYNKAYANPCSVVWINKIEEEEVPQIRFIDVCKIIHIDQHTDSNDTIIISSIVFYVNEDTVAAYDEEGFWEFLIEGGELLLKEEGLHGSGRCPFTPILQDTLNAFGTIRKELPISSMLTKLDWLLFLNVSHMIAEIDDFFPKVAEFENEQDDDTREEGFMHKQIDGLSVLVPNEEYNYNRHYQKRKEKSTRGANTKIVMQMPNIDNPELKDPLKYIIPDYNQAEYRIERIDKALGAIRLSASGVLPEQQLLKGNVTATAIEVASVSRQQILMKTKRSYECLHKFITEVCVFQMEGSVINVNADYGSDFSIDSSIVLAEQYKQAKESGSSETALMTIQQRQINAAYKTNDEFKNVTKLVQSAEPFPTKTVDDVITYNEKGIATDEQLYIKANFATLINTIKIDRGLDFNKLESRELKELLKTEFESNGIIKRRSDQEDV